jgi:hypothetical protein
MIRSLIILFALCISLSGFAQEIESELFYDIEKNRQFELDKRRPAVERGGGALPLPFFDDFSRYSLPTTDPNVPVEYRRWEDDYARINNTFAMSPISIGVATLEGLDRTGYPYDFDDQYAEGPADTLTSVTINLGGYTEFDNIYLVFHYEGGGFGNAPEGEDSLYLDFYSPFGQGEWFQRWSIGGSAMTNFERVFIPITEPEYLLNGFQFRFRNHATISGNYDMWHLDYIVLDQQINPETFDYDEVAMQYPVQRLLNTFTAMPWTHYQSNPEGFMADSFLFFQHNAGPNAENIASGWNITYDGVTTDFPGQTFNVSGNARQELTTTGNLNGFAFDPTVTDTCAIFDFCVYHNPTDAYLQNDTTCFRQEFTDYYSYDDGSAERAFAVQAAGGMLALRFQSAITDTIIGIRVHWTPYGNDPSFSPFLLRLWNDAAGIPGTEIVENFTFHNPTYYQDGYDLFTFYPFDAPAEVSGTFYVGWVQSDAVLYNVGNDKNIDNNTGKLFIKLPNSNWQQSGITGSVMIRPVFKSNKTPIVSVNENTIPNTSIYPNPAQDRVTLEGLIVGEKYQIQIFDMSGKLVLTERTFGNGQNEIPLNDLERGYYILQVSNQAGSTVNHKLMIAE